jgi:hypothetical protein
MVGDPVRAVIAAKFEDFDPALVLRHPPIFEALADGLAPADAEEHAATEATRQIEVEKAMIKKRQLKQRA